MKGVQKVRIGNRHVWHRFELRRNITVVRGDSGTGKTTLFELVADHTRRGNQSGVQLTCDKKCVALVDIDWQNQLENTSDSIVFIDEGARYVTSEEFARAILGSDNYYVLFTREPLYQLPYSINEIYGIKTSGKYHSFVPLYKKKTRNVYGQTGSIRRNYDYVLTEDSKSGYEFYCRRFEGTNLICESAGTNANIYAWLKENEGRRIFVIADGAAFGSHSNRIMSYQSQHADTVTICLPESFEWLLLSTGLVGETEISGILASPSEYIDSTRYDSWEQYFTDLLRRLSKDTPYAYAKNKLAKAWLIETNADKVMALVRNRNVR